MPSVAQPTDDRTGGAPVPAEPDPDRLAALDQRVGLLAAQLHSVSADLVDAVADLHDAGGADGFVSLAQWASVRCGFTRAEAQRLAGLASRRHQLPTVLSHARAGRVSMGVAAMAARVVDEHNEGAVAQIVVATTPTQAARVLARYRSVRGPRPGDQDEPGDADGTAPAPEPDTWWRRWTDELGRGRIDAALSADVAALVDRAWQAARCAGEADAPVTEPADPGDARRDTMVRRLDADEVASRWATTMLDHATDHGLCRPGGDRHAVVVDVDVATLARLLHVPLDPAGPVGLGAHAFDARTGAHLADHQLARMLCDTDLQVLVHHDGAPLWMSNPTRRANRHQRRALLHRSGGGCEHPGCTQTRYLDAHHVRFWSHGGATSIDNLVLLCGHHHRALHRGDISITTGGDQRFTFTDRHGAHLGTSTTTTGAHGPPPDLARRPVQHHPPDPPARLSADSPRSHTHGEHLTSYALDVYLHALLAA